jgi:hypothetical protein
MQNNKYGFIEPEIKPEDYVLGSSPVEKTILNESGQWDNFLPIDEMQKRNGVETMSCVSFGTNNILEILAIKVLGEIWNKSDRFTAIVSGTHEGGNDPKTVIQAVKKFGMIDEPALPFDESIKDINDYLSFGSKNKLNLCYQLGELWIENYKLNYEWVYTTKLPLTERHIRLKEALTYSPVGVAVDAWHMNEDGLHFNLNPYPNHFCVLYGYEEGKYWKIFDTYDNTKKKLLWDYDISFAMSYSLKRIEKKVEEKWWTKLINQLKLIWTLSKPY